MQQVGGEQPSRLPTGHPQQARPIPLRRMGLRALALVPTSQLGRASWCDAPARRSLYGCRSAGGFHATLDQSPSSLGQYTTDLGVVKSCSRLSFRITGGMSRYSLHPRVSSVLPPEPLLDCRSESLDRDGLHERDSSALYLFALTSSSSPPYRAQGDSRKIALSQNRPLKADLSQEGSAKVGFRQRCALAADPHQGSSPGISHSQAC